MVNVNPGLIYPQLFNIGGSPKYSSDMSLYKWYPHKLVDWGLINPGFILFSKWFSHVFSLLHTYCDNDSLTNAFQTLKSPTKKALDDGGIYFPDLKTGVIQKFVEHTLW